ncbi:GvpL/GvpF family gas vesicle protein [Streptomyces cyaneus]|uniref:GvpL/GvpF family gas vesicle protein n=1 Tax=Streptomyces cyaneus TaxID=1904 RepID=UPI000FF8A3E8|nr:GvpL/GvpF family gas vesicle protein [Streptomyces cyaneus]
MTGLRYVYAVCRPFRSALQAQLSGVAGAPPKQLTHHGLIAVVSTVPEADFAEEPLRAHLEDLDWLTATARAHQTVIDALTAVTTPLPLRLATVFRDDSGVRTMMEAREEDFRRVLDRLEGRVEWGVKVYAETEPTEAGKPTEPAKPTGLTEPAEAGRPEPKAVSGRDYLRRRRMQTRAREDVWHRAAAFAGRLHEKLSSFAEDSRLHAPQNSALSRAPGQNVLNAAYLVPRADSEEFVELVDRAKDDAPGIRVELTGPWAAYSFTGEFAQEEPEVGS